MRLPTIGTLRVIGFDDAPFPRSPGPGERASPPVPLVGVVCAGTRFEGMVHGRIARDGWDATETVIELLVREGRGKFLPQLHLILFDGIAVGGFNLFDLELLAARLERPCVAVMRKAPDLPAVGAAIGRLPMAERRLETLRRAGPIHHAAPFWFQVRGGDPDEIARALRRVTDQGHVPEALRLAHVIGTALVTGESGRRA
jgi:endonuclease V-like protein UPF0215 family